MSRDLESKLPNADMQAAPRALLRAALRAREIARETNTAIVIVREGKLVEETVDDAENRSPPRSTPNRIADRLAGRIRSEAGPDP
jgi:hypothetical protein